MQYILPNRCLNNPASCYFQIIIFAEIIYKVFILCRMF